MGDTQPVRIIGSLRGVRQLGRVPCIAEPIGGALAADADNQELLDHMCGQSATMFDVSLGGFVCAECGGALCQHETFAEQLACPCDRLKREKAASMNPFQQFADLPPVERALAVLAWIETELAADFYRRLPQASAAEWRSVRAWAWAHTCHMLTLQTLAATHRSRCNN